MSLRTWTRPLGALGLVAVLALTAFRPAGPAASEPSAPREPSVVLAIGTDDGEGRRAWARLRCVGDRAVARGFLQARARPACAFARREAGFLTSQPEPHRQCTALYGGPEKARMRGRIGARPVDRRFSRINGCAIEDYRRAAPLLG